MVRPVNPKRLSLIAVLIALLTEFFVAFEYFFFSEHGPGFVINIVIFSLYAFLFILIYFFDQRPGVINIIFALLITLVIFALWFSPGSSTDFLVLIYPVAAFPTIYLPFWNGILWVAGIYMLFQTYIVYQFGFEEFVSNLAAIGAFAAYALIGALIRRSNQAYYGIETLYDELREAHDQLQIYSQSVRELAVSEERNRLAREMHDSLGHSLTVAVVQLEGAERLIPTDPQRAGRIIGTMRGQLKESLGELRQTLSRLREENDSPSPPVGNLALALAELESTFGEATGLTVQLSLPDNLPSLTADQRLALFRVAQEGLTNVQRHARASQAWVDVHHTARQITLTIRDDGVGLPETLPDGRFGLQGLAERARVLGGSFEIGRSQNGSGTELLFALPLVDGGDGADE